MEIISLRCNSCGSNLQIKKDIKFFNCTFCGSSLGIKSLENTIFTEVIEEVKENTNTIASNSEIILIENQIARLDREWTIEREKYRINTDSDYKYPEEETSNSSVNKGGILSGIIGITLVIGFLLYWIDSAPSSMKIFGIGILILIILRVIAIISDTNPVKEKYEKAKVEYQDKRKVLLSKLVELNEKKIGK